MARLMSGRIKKREIESELRAQIERTLALGMMPDHIDGHQHVHMMPGVFDIALKLAKEYRIPAMRYPVGPIASFSLSPSPSAGEGRPKAGWGRMLEKLILEGISRRNRHAIEEAGIKTPDYFYGLVETGVLSRNSFVNILEYVPDGTSELMCHPGLPSETLAEDNWGKGWETELAAVTDRSILKLLDEKEIKLTSYRN